MGHGELKTKLQDNTNGPSIAANLDSVFEKVSNLKVELAAKQKEISDMITVLNAINTEASKNLPQ